MTKKRTQLEVLESIEQSAQRIEGLLGAICAHFGVLQAAQQREALVAALNGAVMDSAEGSQPPAQPDPQPTVEDDGSTGGGESEGAAPTEPEAPEETPHTTTPEDEVPALTPAMTLQDANAALVEIITAEGGEAKEPGIRQIIAEYGAKGLNEIDPAKYGEIIEKARAL